MVSWTAVSRLAGSVARAVEFSPYAPLWGHPDVNTIVGRYWPVWLEAGEPRLFTTEPGVQVLGRCHWGHPGLGNWSQICDQFRAAPAPVLVLVHGLEGSAESNYMLWMARAALQAGFDVVRMNVRTCGGTEHLAPTLYHSGLTTDLRAIVDQLSPRRLFVVGFSMGGNQALKLAGEWGSQAPSHVAGVAAISAPIDLAACARRLTEPRNRIYESRFLRQLSQRLGRKARLQPGRFSPAALEGVANIIDFDHRVTAPAFGFRDAWDYYEHSSAQRLLGRIEVPALLIQARDDPFIPFESFRVPPNPALTLLAPERGGHVSFLARGRPRFWAAEQVIRFCQAYA